MTKAPVGWLQCLGTRISSGLGPKFVLSSYLTFSIAVPCYLAVLLCRTAHQDITESVEAQHLVNAFHAVVMDCRETVTRKLVNAKWVVHAVAVVVSLFQCFLTPSANCSHMRFTREHDIVVGCGELYCSTCELSLLQNKPLRSILGIVVPYV